MSKRAIILAGGKGTRLRPYTLVLPKPLMPLCEYPILEVIIRQLVGRGFTHVTMAVNHQADLLKAFFGDGSKWGLYIDYSLEDEPLGTMGPLKLIRDLPDNFLVMNGDVLTDLAYDGFLDQHVARGSVFTISAHNRKHRNEYGVLEVNPSGHLTGFHEKPLTSFLVSMGIYAVSRRALDLIPKQGAFGFDHLMLALLQCHDQPFVENHEGYWLDIGRPDDYEQAIELYSSSPETFLPNKR